MDNPLLWVPPSVYDSIVTERPNATYAKHMSAVSELAPEGYAAVPGIAGPVVPFDQASHVVIEEGPSWTGITLSAEAQTLEQKGIPANGFLRNIWVEVTTETVGNETAGAAYENFPFNIISKLELQDQGGHLISGLTGYNWYLADKYGGYFGTTDLQEVAMYSATLKAPAFTIVIPLELAGTAFGTLTNMTEATKYQLQPTIAAQGKIYKTAMTTNPKLAVKTWIELWTLPEARTLPEPDYPEGRPQEQRPPLEGTIQFWTEQSAIKMNTGWGQLILTRMGQMLRTHIITTYTNEAEPKRSDTLIPPLTQVNWSRVKFKTFGRTIWKSYAKAYINSQAKPVEVGVYPLIYSAGISHAAGANETNSWVPTVNATRYELEGEWTESLVTILTNDVAVAATSEQGRRETPGQTSWHAGRTVS
jgi:hypothetical protein